MQEYIIRRILYTLLTLFGVATILFFHFSDCSGRSHGPGDFAGPGRGCPGPVEGSLRSGQTPFRSVSALFKKFGDTGVGPFFYQFQESLRYHGLSFLEYHILDGGRHVLRSGNWYRPGYGDGLAPPGRTGCRGGRWWHLFFNRPRRLFPVSCC